MSSDFTASSAVLAWLTTLWGQVQSPTLGYVGRWVSAASSPYIYFPQAITTLASYTAISDFYLNITDGTNDDEIGPIDASSATSLADVLALCETELQGITTPNITGLDTATFALDKLSRPVLKNSTTGAAAETLSTKAASTGTDLRNALYLGAGASQAGLDIETLTQAAAAVFEVDNTPFVINQIGASIAQAVAFSTGMNALDKLCEVVDTDPNAKSAVASSDISYQIHALSHQKTHVTYTEHHVDNGAAATQYPDAAICGEILPRLEGKHKWSDNQLASVSQSGLDPDGTTVKPLTPGEIIALKAKGCDFIVTVGGITCVKEGLASGGNEMRVMLGKAFMTARVNEEIWAYMVANEMTFDDDDIQAIKGIISYWYGVMVRRKLLLPGAVITMPSAEDFTTAIKALHTMNLNDLQNASINYAVNYIAGSLTWS